MSSIANFISSKENLYLFLGQLSDAAIYIDRDFQIQYYNPAADKLSDHSLFTRLVDVCKHGKEQLIASGHLERSLSYILESGKLVDLHIYLSVLRTEDHSPAGFVGICKNITAPVNSTKEPTLGKEEDIQTSEPQNSFLIQSHFEAFMKHLPALAWIADEQFVFHYFNEEFKSSMKVSDDKLGCSFEKVYPAPMVAEYKKRNDQVFSTNTLLETIEDGINGEGETCTYKVYRFPLKSIQNKKLLGGIALNITDQIRQQKELAASNERFMYVNKATSDAIWDWDIATDKIYRGEGYAKLLGSTDSGPSLRQHVQFIHIKDRKRVIKSIKTALDNNKDYWQEEYRFLCKDGTYHHIVDKGYIVRNQKGQPIRMIGAMEDISKNRLLEKVLVEKEAAKKKEIIKAIIDAQEKERTQISYELHEQLSQNLATCKLLLEGLLFPDSKEEEKIRLRSSMKLLTQTMNGIRSMSHQLNANAITMIGLVGVMRDVTSTINQNWQVEVQLQCNGFSNATVLPKDIEVSTFRIFQEGMNNVIRHSGASHAIVQLTKKNKWLVLSINDNGKGFDVATTPKGLGFMNIINRVEYHNGTVLIDSYVDGGCTLEVKLPISDKNGDV
jgi:two-component system sensor histidine kinase UhpB